MGAQFVIRLRIGPHRHKEGVPLPSFEPPPGSTIWRRVRFDAMSLGVARRLSLSPSSVLSILAVAVFAGGCSASAAQGEAAGAGDGTGAGNTENGGGPVIIGQGGGLQLGGGGPGLDPDDTCASSAATAGQIPLDMLIILDRSGSMDGSNWEGATGAIKDFVDSPQAVGVNLALSYFPDEESDFGSECNHKVYQDPTVPLGELPDHGTAIKTSLDTTEPGGGTPMYGALKGGLFFATAHQEAHPERKVVVVMSSDGEPNSCEADNGNDINVIAELAAKARNYNGVLTFAIAINGANVSSLDKIAIQGGTTSAFDVTNDVTAFAEKMEEIRQSALACEFILPEPPEGEELDPKLVNVTYRPEELDEKLPYAENLADCSDGAGWYYDNANAPTRIILCPASCEQAKADGSTSNLEVSFGCKTVPN